MQTTNDFLDALKSLNRKNSDGETARLLGVNASAMSNYRHGRSFFDDAVCERVAVLLGLPPQYVLACIHAERAKTDSQKAIWSVIADKFQYAAASVLVVVGALLGAPFLSS